MTPHGPAPDAALPPHPAVLAGRARHALSAERPGRIELLDQIRGVAIAGVVVYHFSWDLNLFGLLATDVTMQPIWVMFARSLAATFMVLVGINLVLAQGERIRWRPFLRRFMVVTAAASVISVVTYAAFPESFIYFGILHAIAASSVLGLAFLRAPTALLLIAAVALFLAPQFIQSDALNPRLLAWTGLARLPPRSVDFVPLFPWFALPLMGILGARLTLASPMASRVPGRTTNRRAPRALAWAGRHSLIIYLLHQPVLLGALYALTMISAS